MLSLALRHKKKRLVEAMAKAKADTVSEARAAVDALHALPETAAVISRELIGTVLPSDKERMVWEAQLGVDLKRLKDLSEIKDKLVLKDKELLNKYLPVVKGYIASKATYKNPILVRCALWAIDVGNLELGLTLSDAAIASKQLVPIGFKRDLPTLLAEEITTWAEQQLEAGESGSPFIDAVCARLLDNRWPTTNELVRGKAFRIAGLLAEKNADERQALAYYEQAQQENEAAGCKGRVKALRKKFNVPDD